MVVGEKNRLHESLLARKYICLPHSHIKLELIKNLVKGMNRSGSTFQYTKNKFPKVSKTKIKEGVGTQIRQLTNSETNRFRYGSANKRNMCLGIVSIM